MAEPVQHGMHGWTGDVQSIDCSLPTSDHEDEPSETSGLHSVVRSHERHKIRRDTSDPRGAPLEAGAARVARRIRACGKSPSPPRSAVLAPATPRAPLLPAAGLLPWSRPCLTSCRPSRCVTAKSVNQRSHKNGRRMRLRPHHAANRLRAEPLTGSFLRSYINLSFRRCRATRRLTRPRGRRRTRYASK